MNARTSRPSSQPQPHELWEQSNGDKAEYLRLMVEHGHLIPVKRRDALCGSTIDPRTGGPCVLPAGHSSCHHGTERSAAYCARTFGGHVG